MTGERETFAVTPVPVRSRLLVLVEDSLALASARLEADFLRHEVTMVDAARVADLRNEAAARAALNGSNESCRDLARRANAELVLVVRARSIPVPNEYGLTSIRVEMDARLVDGASGHLLESWFLADTAAHLAPATAERQAMESVLDDLAGKVSARAGSH